MTFKFIIHYIIMYYKSISIETEHPPNLIHFDDVLVPLITKNNNIFDDISDLELFFSLVYSFYINKGFYPSIFKKIVIFVQYIIIIITLFFISYQIDYSKSIELNYIVIVNFQYTFFNIICILISFITGIIYIYSSLNFIKNIYTVKKFYNNFLNLYDNDLNNIKWSSIIELIIKAQDTHKFYKLHHSLSNYQIVNHIMRTDNLILVLIHNNIITTHVNIPYINYSWPYLPKLYIICINLCIIQSIFDNRKQFLLNDNSSAIVQQNILNKIKFCSLFILCFSPFILIILSMYFLFRYFEDFRQNQQTIRTRKWSRYSTWLFRQHNEMYHLLHQRLSIAYIYSDSYLKSFTNNFINIIARFIAFICGTVLVTLLSFSIIDEDFLHIHIYQDKTAVWFIGICTIILAICRTIIPNEYQLFIPEKLMTKIIHYTHYSPDIWKNNFHTIHVKNDFALLFQHRFIYILEELSSVIFVPFLLFFKVQYEIPQIITFLKNNLKKDTAFNLGYIYNSSKLTSISTIKSMINIENSLDQDMFNILNNSFDK